jgi:hypothetical protein
MEMAGVVWWSWTEGDFNQPGSAEGSKADAGTLINDLFLFGSADDGGDNGEMMRGSERDVEMMR